MSDLSDRPNQAAEAASADTRVLFVSNGAGEDSIAAQIIKNIPNGITPEVLPLVGRGASYHGVAEITGPVRSMPSGGLIAMDLKKFWNDVIHGLALLTLRQLWFMFTNRRRYSQVVAVGDLWPVILAVLSGIRPITFIGTAKSDYHHPYSALECWVLRTFGVRSMVRDEPTAHSLQENGVKAAWVGNAMMDGLESENTSFKVNYPEELGLALFPGSRQATYEVLPRLLSITQKLAARIKHPICGMAAVAPSIDTAKLAQSCSGFRLAPAPYPGWNILTPEKEDDIPGCQTKFYLVKDHLADVLSNCQLALGLAGTAHEQAAGFGIPVVAYEPGGESNMAWYRARQKGLLGEALIVSDDNDDEILSHLERLFNNPDEMQERGNVGRVRLGPPGGAKRMAEIIAKISGI